VLDLAQAQQWKGGIVGKLTGGVGALLRKNGVQVVQGRGTVVDGKTVDVATREGEPVRIALRAPAAGDRFAGRVAAEPAARRQRPLVDGSAGLTERPKHLVVVGAGYIGLELGIAWRKLGAEVAIVEAAGRVLPTYDEELTKPVLAILRKLGITLHLELQRARPHRAGRRAARAQQPAPTSTRCRPTRCWWPWAAAAHGRGSGWRAAAGHGRAYVKVDEQCRTSMRNVWAIGDLTGEPMLAHRAMAQGELVAEVIAGHKRRFAPQAIPAVCFTDPEIVVAGSRPTRPRRAGWRCWSARSRSPPTAGP
jgi:dihydrolipoamide dehydrogenase